jgi:hypothetical protein
MQLSDAEQCPNELVYPSTIQHSLLKKEENEKIVIKKENTTNPNVK